MPQGPCLKTHCSRPVARDSLLETRCPYLYTPRTGHVLYSTTLFYSFCSFRYIIKSKFGDYGTLDALAEQRRVQGGNFDPRVLMDGSPSRNKIRRKLMIEKVVERIDELDQPHLQLLVMHDFMWALVEEWASSKARSHRISNQDSNRDV